jgi:hypothetical protein
MSITRRGKVSVAVVTALLVAGGALGYFALFPDQAPAIVRTTLNRVGLVEAPPPPPPSCPLTGELAEGGLVPDRPALAVKIENYPDARPQAGLQSADIIYEEPVEGGITRFIAVYQCRDDTRVGPVRSARTVDPQVLGQLGVPILAYSGGAPGVLKALEDADLVTLDESSAGGAFVRDEGREAPHNLYASTAKLHGIAHSTQGPPAPLFTYADELTLRSRRATSVHLPFSSTYADVWWSWDRQLGEWVRAHGEVPHTVESGGPVSADNVVVQIVEMTIPDGRLTPELQMTGSGRAYVFRDGRMVVGRWERPTLGDVTIFVTKDGTEIPLAPGRTWVELLPSTARVETAR